MEAFKEAMRSAAEKGGGSFQADKPPATYDTTIWVSEGPNAISVVYPSRDNIFPFIRELSWALGGAPFLAAHIQEGSLWDYSLCRGGDVLDTFSTFPQYWDGEQDPITLLGRKGNPEILSLAFGVPQDRFDRYLKHWNSDWDEKAGIYRTRLEGKAYPQDRSTYQDYEQLWDFLGSLGIHDPCGWQQPARHVWELNLPEPVRPVIRKGWRKYLPWRK